MESVSDGGDGVSVPTPATVPLLVRPEALAATANRLEALADQLQPLQRVHAVVPVLVQARGAATGRTTTSTTSRIT